jgi:S1-C subfamily serine protease
VGSVIPHPEFPARKLQFYRLDIPVNPGNSGGPVILEEDGTVVGIVQERPLDLQPVVIPGRGRTDLHVPVPSGLTHAFPIHPVTDIAPMLRRLTIPELDEIQLGRMPSWWEQAMKERWAR